MSSLTPQDLLAEGAVLAEPTPDTMPAVARGYVNPLLPGRTVVTVLPERLVEAEDIANATLGFEGSALTPVGHVPSRAIGFPAWPIITDPANAHHALAIVADLTRVKRQAKNSKGAAKETVDELATRLAGAAPHFLPTYFEEVGRIFLAVESPTFAAQYFGKAREAETTYGIAVDEDRHRRAFLDFALDGALSAKALAAEARRLTDAFAPGEAYERYVDVVLRRVRGGLPPQTDLPKDVKRLGKAAGLKPADALAAVASALLPLPSLRGASAGLWKGLLPGVIDAVNADAALIEHLVAYIPDAVEFEAWTDVLDATGALDWLATQASAEELATWTELAIGWVGSATGWRAKDTDHTLAVLLERLPLNKIQRALDVGLGINDARLDVVDVVLAAGVEPILGSAREMRLGEQTVWTWIESSATRDLAHVAAHDILGPFVAARTADGRRTGRPLTPERAQAISASPGVLALLNRALDIDLPIGEPKRANVNRSAQLRARYGDLAHPAIADSLRLAERTAHFAVPSALLAAHLNIGVGAELAWPAWEELDDAVPQVDVRAYYSSNDPDIVSWPYVGMVHDREIVVVGPEGEVLRQTPVLVGVTTRSLRNAVIDLQEVGGRWALAFRDDQWGVHFYWLDDPAHIVDPKSGTHYHGSGEFTTPLAGRRIFGINSVVEPGDEPILTGSANLLVDDNRCWVTDRDSFTEIDVATGARLASTRPAWIEAVAATLPERFNLLPVSARQRPGHLGVVTAVAEGVDRVEWRMFRSDGARVDWETSPTRTYYYLGHHAPRALIDIPGGRWRASAHEVVDVATGCRISDRPQFDVDDERGRTLPLSFSDLLRVRSELVSLRLRSITPDEVRALAEAAAAGLAARGRLDRSEVKGDMITREEEAALDAAIPGARGRLRTAILGAARWASLDAARWSVLFAERSSTPARGWRSSEWDGAVTSLLRPSYYRGDPSADVRSFIHSIATTASALAGESDDTPSSTEFEIVAAHVQAPGVLAALAAVADAAGARARITEVAEKLLEAGLADGRAWVRELDSAARSVRENVVARTDAGVAVTAAVGWMDPPLVIGLGDPSVVDAGAVAPARMQVGPLGDDLRGVLAAIGEHGQVPRRPDEIAEFASATGLSEVAVTLLLTTALGADLADSDTAALRESLGYKATQIKQAREDLARFSRGTRFTALALAIPFPVSAWWVDDEPARQARRTAWAAAAAQLTAERPPMLLSAEERARARKELGYGAEAAELLATPAGLTNIDPDKRFASPNGSHYTLTQLWTALLWFGATLSSDHQIRAALPELARFVADRVRDPQELTTVQRIYHEDTKEIEGILGLPRIDLNVPRSFDVGAFQVVVEEHKCVEVRVRVGAMGPDEAPTLEALLGPADDNYYAHAVRPLVAAARGDLEQAIAAFDPVGPPGELRDPRFSAPRVVSAMMDALGLDEHAATYYLQVLALPRPADADIKRFNDWKPAAFSKARAALLDAGLVVEAKRSRAMRTVFLPGAWVDLKYDKGFPVEGWKLPFLGIADYGARRAAIAGAYPLLSVGYARLYEWAWERYAAGDRPEFITLDEAMEARRRG